jgi:hypothetical protein
LRQPQRRTRLSLSRRIHLTTTKMLLLLEFYR